MSEQLNLDLFLGMLKEQGENLCSLENWCEAYINKSLDSMANSSADNFFNTNEKGLPVTVDDEGHMDCNGTGWSSGCIRRSYPCDGHCSYKQK